MTRLPQPGSDSGQWGQILNDFLAQVHNVDGTLKDNVVTTSALAPAAVNAANVAAPGGTNGQVLAKDSAEPNGLAWVTISGADAYTQAEVDALLAVKTNDVDAVKMTGNQSIAGVKNFASLQAGGQAVVVTNDPRLSDARNPLNGSVTTASLADASVTSAKIVDGTIAEADLSPAVITKLNAAGSGLGVQKAGILNGTRPAINLLEGSNVSISATDDPINNRVNIAISSAGAGGAVDASTTTKGIVKLAGDLAGTADTPVVADGAIVTARLADNAVTTAKLIDNSVSTAKIINGAVNTVKLANNAVDQFKLNTVAAPTNGQVLSYDGSGLAWVTASGADAYTQAEVDALLAAKANDVGLVKTTGNQSITGVKNFATLQAGGQSVVVTNDSRLSDARNPLNGSVTTISLADGAVTEPKIGAVNSPSLGQLLSYDGTGLSWTSPAAAGDPTLGGDLTGTLSTAKIAAASVGTVEISDNSVTNAKLADAAVDTLQLADDSVTGPKLADASVTSAKIVDGTIAEADLSPAVITKLNAAGSGLGVQKAGILNGTRPAINLLEGSNVSISATDDPINNRVNIAISSAGAGGAVDASTTTKGIVKLAGDLAGTADTPVVADGAIVTARLADNAVTTAKLIDNSVSTAKIINGAVNTVKLANNAVYPAKLNTVAAPTNGQVLSYDGTLSQMKWVTGASVVTLAGAVTGSSSATVITNGAVSAAKLSATGATAGQVLSYDGSALAWVSSGATLLAGSGAPSAGTGSNGDVYIDTDTNILYGPKTGGVWPGGQDLTGPAGPTGAAGAEGISPPPFAQLGDLTVGTGTVRWYNDTGSVLNIDYVRATVGTKPQGQTIIVDVNANGTSIFTTSPKPTIAVNTFTKKVTAMETTTIASGGYLTIDIDQVGTSTAGADLYVTIGLSR